MGKINRGPYKTGIPHSKATVLKIAITRNKDDFISMFMATSVQISSDSLNIVFVIPVAFNNLSQTLQAMSIDCPL